MRISSTIQFFIVLISLTLFQKCYSVPDEQLYDLLGLTSHCTASEIETAFQNLQNEYDHSKSHKKAYQDLYQNIQTAYSILSNKNKRSIYDTKGLPGLQTAGRENSIIKSNNNMFGNFGNFFGGNVESEGNSFTISFGGNSRTVRSNSRNNKKKGNSYKFALDVSLEDIYKGCKLKIPYTKNVLKRRGSSDLIRKNTELEIVIKPGTPDKREFKFEKAADEGENIIPGDIIFVLNQAEDPILQRDGSHLIMETELTLYEALTGFEREFEHPSGEMTTVTSKTVTKPGMMRKYRGLGMPIEGTKRKGDLIVTFKTKFPESFTEEEKNKIQKIFNDK
ncbi:DNAj-related protein scj1 [Anaeramoeba flamelloides]|uniref:DNAj-related protein scj1 n=1 Tax=Anaeramoeba flamelloides TaxID=1746091 RepID=A0AAV8A9T5_9EUKA|nr:DNAj-related protein scj1 [Anaeramoeba flamelloides]